MSVSEIRNPLLAKWPPSPDTRRYFLSNESEFISAGKRGKDLPAKAMEQEFTQREEPEFHANLLDSTRLFTNLPPKFFEAYLRVQKGIVPITLPRIMHNKNVTVRSCFIQHSAFNDPSGSLHVQHWKALGWPSQQAYEEWLDTSMLFAFSNCLHYCTAPRVFDADVEKNSLTDGRFYFTQVANDSQTIGKKTNILSVTGFEYRDFKGDIKPTLPAAKKHSQITMEQILAVAALTNTTDIVLIPYGMGVFLPKNQDGDAIKKATFEGMIEALRQYDGPFVTIQCCGWPEFYKLLSSANNKNIHFEDTTGYDAYTLANDIQDCGDDVGEKQEGGAHRPRKSLLINAADNDWTALLDPEKIPGQFSDNHTLYDATSDEYYAIVMCFAYFSIQRMMDFFKETFVNKITQVSVKSSLPCDLKNVQNDAQVKIPEQIQEAGKETVSSLTEEQIGKIDALILKLTREINSCWPYPNKDRKQYKINGLNALKRYAQEEDLLSSLAKLDVKYPKMSEGIISHRTEELLDDLTADALKQESAQITL
jgi:hypothetical protein